MSHTILYVGGSRTGGDPLGLLQRSGAWLREDGSVSFRSVRGTDERQVFAASEPTAALTFLREHPVEALVLDTRERAFAEPSPNPSQSGPFALSRAARMLDGIRPEGQPFAGIPLNRVIAIVDESAAGAQAAYQLGAYRIGSVLVSPSLDQLLAQIDTVFERHATGRIALCLAGGGIEGLFYELGILRALDWFLADRSVVDFDLFSGISAGAVVGSFLANGLGPDEIARGLSGESTRMSPIRRSELFDPNFAEIPERLRTLGWDVVRRPQSALAALGRAVPSGVFAGDGLRAWLRRELARPGMSDRFGKLRRPLYVGTTDQDTSQAVVFGEEGTSHVPVHRAVRASAALAPFYAPERINGRYYIDGAFSRTTNMRVAVREGATLVILIDPLVPVRSEDPGYVHRRGGLFGTMQGLKALVNGRFDKAVRALAEMYPDVSFWLFRPQADEMRMLAGSPMKYFYRREIEQLAFDRSVHKMRTWLPQMASDFARHGATLRDPEREVERPEPMPLQPSWLGVGL